MTEMTASTTADKTIRIGGMATTQPFGLLGRLLARWQSRRWQRRDHSWLQSQPDYLLRDIGVSRAEIEAVLRAGRYR